MATDSQSERHLRDHLTDGFWHDDCPYCRRRRIYGGTGVEPRPAPQEER